MKHLNFQRNPFLTIAVRRVALFFAFLLFIPFGVAQNETPEGKELHACCKASSALVAEEKAPLPDRSLYQLEGSWTNQDAQPLRLRHFRGQPMLVAMIFTHCTYACPRIIADISALLQAANQPKLRVLLLSMDPARDTPQVMRDFRDRLGLDPARWTLIRADQEQTLELAAALGVRFKPEADGGFAHSNLVSVLDGDGQVVFQQVGLGSDPAETLRTIEGLFPATGQP